MYCFWIYYVNLWSFRVWDISSKKNKKVFNEIDPKKASATCLAISPVKPTLLACSSIASTLTFFDINEEKRIKTISTESPLTSVAFHDNGHTFAVGGASGSLFVYDLRNLKEPISKINLEGHKTSIKSI